MGGIEVPKAQIRRALRSLGGGSVRASRRLGVAVRRRCCADRLRPALYRGSVLDDFLFGQPLNTVMRALRVWGRRRKTHPGVTVVVVNWNTKDALAIALASVRKYSPPDTEVIVIDNGSTDGSREWLSRCPFPAKVIRLPFNIGHGRALDLGAYFARTSIIVTLDSDAFPYSRDWLSILTSPITEHGYAAAGMWGRRDRLHPACSALLRHAWFRTGLSFANHAQWLDTGEEPVFLENCWDTAELVFLELGRTNAKLIPVDRSRFGGITMSDAVYHHEGVTTMTMYAEDLRDPTTHGPAFAAAVKALLTEEP